LPEAILGSPLPALVFTGLFTLLAVVLKLELEYFMIFYATFFVGYAGLALLRAFHTGQGNALPQIKMFCVGSVAVVIFAYGYFLANPLGMILGSILPVGYVGWLLWIYRWLMPQSQIYLFVLVASNELVISYYGNWLIPSCTSRIFSGLTLMRLNCIKRLIGIAKESVALVARVLSLLRK